MHRLTDSKQVLMALVVSRSSFHILDLALKDHLYNPNTVWIQRLASVRGWVEKAIDSLVTNFVVTDVRRP